MSKYLLPLIGSLLLSGSAEANCAAECIVPHPFSGDCKRKVKFCDPDDPLRAVARVASDFNAAMGDIWSAWQGVYGGTAVAAPGGEEAGPPVNSGSAVAASLLHR